MVSPGILRGGMPFGAQRVMSPWMFPEAIRGNQMQSFRCNEMRPWSGSLLVAMASNAEVASRGASAL